MTSDTSRFCGIDLGTTNSCIAVLEQGQPRVVPLDGQNTMPSMLAWKDGQWLAGTAARNHYVVAPQEAVISIKRKMDDPGYRVELGGQQLSPVDVSAKILEALVGAAQRELGEAVTRAVITVPAWFQEQQRQATLEAGRRAGLDVLQIVNEPTAAAIAHERIQLDDGAQERWLVYDLGGGTFDVSLLNVTAASYEVLASEGNTFLGGDDFDHRLVERFIAHLRDRYNVDAAGDVLARTRLRFLAENTKIQLSHQTEVTLHEPLTVGGDNVMLELRITREDFEALIGDLIDSTLDKAAQVLADVNSQSREVDRLLLVGGSTRIPLVAERLKQRFDIDPESWLDADLSVALGACTRAAICCGEIFDRSVVDICPHSLGIAAVGEEDHDEIVAPTSGRDHPLTFAPLIRRYTRLPASFSRTFYKAHPSQKGAVVPVYQGENSNTRHNNFIGQFFIEFSQSRSEKLDVCFQYDVNGTIKIIVSEGSGGSRREFTMDLARSVSENSEDGGFGDNLTEHEQVGEDDSEDEARVTNFLIEKVSQKLEQCQPAPEGIVELMERYKDLLGREDADEQLDELEDQLYEWVEDE
ncbi:Hsp70 family protein [Microbulbifer rhizosphaerae]|uniref:Molecular chaperone DnaK n=1 Tax=Microbulbifer rhizosphaerae TaxID=1562603 RepID=A0A7W4WCG4_9GAMM|nr:molecular chaperone DnaK [Microbulbifer rhizosphaerae]